MTLQDRISAWLDGALPPEEAARLEAEAAADPTLAAKMQAAQEREEALSKAFDTLLEAPLPPGIMAVVSGSTQPGTRNEEASPTVAGAMAQEGPAAPAPEVTEAAPYPAHPGEAAFASNPPGGTAPRGEMPPDFAATNTNGRAFTPALIAAVLALLVVGAGGGALFTRGFLANEELADGHATRGWMEEIADYHRVYARQTAHLVEVPASETPHIEAWLGRETGVPLNVPDLSALGFTFQGARLLVAGGRPVAQLLYTDAEGGVMALCGLALEGGEPLPGFTAQSFGDDLEMVRWNPPGAAWVTVGKPDMALDAVARAAADNV
ncbi:zf-HC2 domain-containing protein [Vannielia sp.]|uniref:zf-HC2 domain-containing protein n=1 Tax=Vannielia sp. TaxID=2813045 RepID=UPI00260BC84C|nr:zf-HC2 domain-containing protein [Vannielia sp.]MDF1873160.1 zf-HC2 domain-containing protein [Vannielia sp.]